jgi:nitrogen-specific signal transduction histidine kinase/CheY-like chemotaxis protein
MLTALRGGSGSLAGFMMALKDLSAERHWRDVETQAARAVVEATRMKSEFLANVSHELRTPLNAMVGYADILLDMDPTPEQRETIGRIRGATESMHNLIVNLLDSAKVERGGLEVELTPFGLRTVVQDVLAAAAPRAHQRDLELCCEIDANVPDEVSGAPSRLVQILEQLLDNAIKFTPTGEIVVRLMVDGPTRGGQLIHFSVADTGIGVPPDQRGIVFEPFVQVDGSMRRQYGGTGLGLTIARHLIQHMGGEIWIESRPEGSGTTVHFLLPLANPRPFRVPAATTLAWHVLVADDNPTARRIVGEMLERLGMIPHVAETASETESVLRSGRTGNHLVQIALVDADLRHANGTTFAAAIGANPTRVPIILMTSPRHPDDVLQYRNLTAAGYLAKPLHELPLARMLGAAMKRSRRRPGRPVAARRRVGPDDLPS